MKPPPAKSRERELAGQIEDALLHYDIGLRTHNTGLYVDWEYVAYRMAQALSGWAEVELGPKPEDVPDRRAS